MEGREEAEEGGAKEQKRRERIRLEGQENVEVIMTLVKLKSVPLL